MEESYPEWVELGDPCQPASDGSNTCTEQTAQDSAFLWLVECQCWEQILFSDWSIPSCLMSHKFQMWARMFCGSPVWSSRFLISTPDTKPSLSLSVCLNRASYLSLSPALTTQGTAATLLTAPAGYNEIHQWCNMTWLLEINNMKMKLKLTLKLFILLTVSLRLLLAWGDENEELKGSGGAVGTVGVLEEGW